jgi:hypothetical protein
MMVSKEINLGVEMVMMRRNITPPLFPMEKYFSVYDEGFMNLTCHDFTWEVDSAASFYVTSRRDLFSSYNQGDYGIVRMEDNEVCKISNIEDENVKISIGCKLILKNVRYVPDIRLHLISVGTLDDDGY